MEVEHVEGDLQCSTRVSTARAARHDLWQANGTKVHAAWTMGRGMGACRMGLRTLGCWTKGMGALAIDFFLLFFFPFL